MRRLSNAFPGGGGATRWVNLIFAAMAVFVGVVAVLIIFFIAIRPEWRVNHDYVEQRGLVLDKRLAESQNEDGTTYRPEIQVRYVVNGREYQVWTYDAIGGYSSFRSAHEQALQGFTVGRECPVWYDPAAPKKAVVVRGYTWWLYLVLLLPVGVIVGGLVGLVRVLRPRRLPFPTGPESPQPASAPPPGLPDPGASQESAGAVLAVSLRPAVSPGQLRAVTAACLVGGGGLVVGGVLAVIQLQFLGALVGVAFGLGLLYVGGRKALVHLRVGATAVEVSEHPVRPEQPFQLCVRQEGPLRLRVLRVTLVCEEAARYRQGTDTRTETRCVYRRVLLHEKEAAAGPNAPFVGSAEVTIPPGAMHSFQAAHNDVRWEVAVHGEPAGLPKFDRKFSLVVAPPLVARAADVGGALRQEGGA
jgi:hypothetical protein